MRQLYVFCQLLLLPSRSLQRLLFNLRRKKLYRYNAKEVYQMILQKTPHTQHTQHDIKMLYNVLCFYWIIMNVCGFINNQKYRKKYI